LNRNNVNILVNYDFINIEDIKKYRETSVGYYEYLLDRAFSNFSKDKLL